MSENSVDHARQSAAEKAYPIHYCVSDYVKSEISGEFDLITMIYCDFGVLEPQERQLVLKKVYNSLSPGGCFLFDVFTPFEYEYREEFKTRLYEENGFWRQEPALVLQSFYRYDEKRLYLNQYIIVTVAETTNYNVWEHTFLMEELKEDLKEAGFHTIDFYGNVAGKPYNESCNTLCIIAKKE